MSFKVSGLNEFERDLAKVMNDMPSEVMRFMNSLTNELMHYVKKNTPKDTGHLRRNWFFRKALVTGDNYFTIIGNNIEYAPYIEYGHRIVNRKGQTIGFVEGHYMLQKNIDIINKQMSRRLADFLDDLLKKGKLA